MMTAIAEFRRVSPMRDQSEFGPYIERVLKLAAIALPYSVLPEEKRLQVLQAAIALRNGDLAEENWRG